MNWQSINFDWNQARAFLVTAEEGSLSAAARALGLTQPTLSRQVAALEASLGVTLFERVSKSLVLTQAGLELADHVRAMGEAASRVSLSASGQAQQIDGLVTIAATDIMAAYILPEILTALRKAAPGIEVRLHCSNSLSDLRRREADIAIRHVAPDHPDLYARKLRDAPARIYAARSFLNRLNRPVSLEDARHLDFVGYDNNEEFVMHLQALGLPVSLANIKVSSPSGVVSWEYVRRGLGLSMMADEVADRCPEVDSVFDELAPVTFPIWLVTHRELNTSRRIRLVFDFLADGLLAVAPARRVRTTEPLFDGSFVYQAQTAE
ncbi:LysR family transcriptional regulator [Roseibium denhamense]|uniref:Transcriptional regulator, LysR family n=1 Tax=Roseibium denhamense TaxID=76305 RepID=A0ABY1P5S2_9HYPH|nr:LysR family transcriptional regulator [Roseibium denhamense]SMP26875.1 transcriptional regulator, LysR family [Roseibium denhamense]